MLTKEQLQGVLVSLPKTEITVSRDERHIVGYAVRLGVHFRAHGDFLTAIHRTLLQYEVESKWKDIESKVRPKPIISIRGTENLRKICDIVPAIPDYRNQWIDFMRALEIVENDGHYSQEGIDEILRIKGVL